MTYSVNNIRIDNTLLFGTGATAGYVLAVNPDGSTYWSSPQGGSSGASGSSGTSGSSGSSGINGTIGSNGVSGSNGSSGTSGSSGINGSNGVNGSSGTSGVNGTSGSSPSLSATIPSYNFSNLAMGVSSNTSASNLMFGFGNTSTWGAGTKTDALYTPFSTDLRVGFQLDCLFSSTTATYTIELRYGTGTPPSAGAAATGTVATTAYQLRNPTANTRIHLALSAIVKGLTPGVQYWFDISIQPSSSAYLTVYQEDFQVIELTGAVGPAGTSGTSFYGTTSGTSGTSVANIRSGTGTGGGASFTTALPNANYALTITGGSDAIGNTPNVVSKSASGFSINWSGGGSPTFNYIAVSYV